VAVTAILLALCHRKQRTQATYHLPVPALREARDAGESHARRLDALTSCSVARRAQTRGR